MSADDLVAWVERERTESMEANEFGRRFERSALILRIRPDASARLAPRIIDELHVCVPALWRQDPSKERGDVVAHYDLLDPDGARVGEVRFERLGSSRTIFHSGGERVLFESTRATLVAARPMDIEVARFGSARSDAAPQDARWVTLQLVVRANGNEWLLSAGGPVSAMAAQLPVLRSMIDSIVCEF